MIITVFELDRHRTETDMTQTIPPKQTVTGSPGAPDPTFGQPYATPAEQPGALVSIHNAALHANPDSFPVLKAFQDYLETERKRARQRLILLSAFFAVLLVVVMIGLIAIGVYLFGNMSKTQNQLLAAVLEQRVPAPVIAEPAKPAPAEKPAIDPDTLARVIEERVAAKIAEASKPAAPTPSELDEIKAALTALQRENEALKSQPKLPPTVGPLVPRSAIAHLNPPPAPVAAEPATPTVPAPVAVVEAPPPATAPQPPSPAPQPPPPVTAAATPPAEPKKPLEPPSAAAAAAYDKNTDRLTLDIPSKNADKTIPWRIVLPPR